MGTNLADPVDLSLSDVYYQWAENLGLTPSSRGLGELLGLIASAAAGQSAQGGLSLQPANTVAATLPRSGIASQAIVVASGTLQLEAVYLTKGTVINNVNWVSGSTAGATLNHQWGVLANSALSVVAVSADSTSAAIAANTAITYALSAAYTVPTSGIYYAGVMVSNNAGTQPTFAGATAGNVATNNIAPKIGGTSNTSATTPVAVAATLTAITSTAGIIYIYLT